MEGSFFAILSRMKYIERWALMRSSRPENLSEHACEVAMIAHALCVLGNVRYGKALNAEKAALIGLFHDASEIITGDMPTPVKYANSGIREAYKDVERSAEERLLASLPEDIRPVYEEIFGHSLAPAAGSAGAEDTTAGPADALTEPDEDERYLRRLVKAADKISALIKCIEEDNAGNREFSTARRSTEEAVGKMRGELPEVDDFMRSFLPSYGNTLDELL